MEKCKIKLILSLVFRPNHPVCSISIGCSNRDQPQTRVRAKDLQKVLVRPYVVDIRPCVRIPLAFQIIESRRVSKYELDVESEKHADDYKESRLNGQSYCSDNESYADSLFVVDETHDILDEKGDFNGQRKYQSQDYIEQKKHEKFSIAEAYTVSDPRAVVVHIQHAPLAS